MPRSALANGRPAGDTAAMRYDLNQIETFLAVLETGTVTAAAARLNLSKSVVSTRISDFEATIGAALFRRNAGRIAPTSSGGGRSCRPEPGARPEGDAQSSSSIDTLSGLRTKAMWPSRGGRWIVWPAAISRSHTA